MSIISVPNDVVEWAQFYARKIDAPVWVYWSPYALDFHTTQNIKSISNNDTIVMEIYSDGTISDCRR